MKTLFALPIFVPIACNHVPSKPLGSTPRPLPQTLREAVTASEFRSPDFKTRDVYRHPLETLTFFDIRPEQTVVEIAPGHGWYTQILAPFLVPHGRYIAAGNPNKEAPELKVWKENAPEVTSHITVAEFIPPRSTKIGPANSVDRVVTFRNVHNWMANGGADAAFAAFFQVLKPGGILGVEEHRGNPHAPQDPEAKSGYVREDVVIKMAEKAGFVLIAKSDLNANPRDLKDYPAGVWTLPPTLKLKDQDRAKYEAIGESDRMTLKFRKPLSAR